MIALDTNILVRYLTEDDPVQSGLASELIDTRLSGANPGFVSIPVLCEMLWTLRSRYGRSQHQLRAIAAELLNSARIVVDEAAVVQLALALPSAEVTDAIIHEIGRARGCEGTLTLDQDFARLEGVELLS